MKLQLADGHLEPPLGLLEGVSITTCGIKFIHTFVVVDFGRKIAYDIILGRPFMRLKKMNQDWGSNHLYLRHANAITRDSTIDHTYKDVRETPIREYDSVTSQSQEHQLGNKLKLKFGCVEHQNKVAWWRNNAFMIGL